MRVAKSRKLVRGTPEPGATAATMNRSVSTSLAYYYFRYMNKLSS